MSKQHGGKREGSGRKPLASSAMRKVCVTLTDRDVEWLRTIGKGNVSEGVRQALHLAILGMRVALDTPTPKQ